MQKRKSMAILSLIFIIIGTIMTAIVTINYRGNADILRRKIDSLTTENNSINKRNEELNKTINNTTSKNQELVNSNLELTKRIEDLSKLTFYKAKELQYPISDNFNISYSISFKANDFIKLKTPKEHGFSFFALSLPKEFELIEDNYNKQFPDDHPKKYKYLLTRYLKKIFAKGGITINLKKGNQGLFLRKSYNEKDIFDKRQFNNVDSNLPYINPTAHVFHKEGDDTFYFEFKNLSLRIFLNSGNNASIFDLNEFEVSINIGSYNEIEEVKLESLALFMGNKFIFGSSNLTYDDKKKAYTSSDKVKLHLK